MPNEDVIEEVKPLLEIGRLDTAAATIAIAITATIAIAIAAITSRPQQSLPVYVGVDVQIYRLLSRNQSDDWARLSCYKPRSRLFCVSRLKTPYLHNPTISYFRADSIACIGALWLTAFLVPIDGGKC